MSFIKETSRLRGFAILIFFLFIDMNELVNHPVHIMNKKGQLYPTALIPFCSFGGNMKILGQQVNGFSVPVCTSFNPTMFNGKLCYSLDVNNVLTQEQIAIQYGERNGLSLLIDTNQDRHFGYFKGLHEADSENDGHFVKSQHHDREVSIYVGSLEPVKVVGGGNIALDSIKKIDGDKAYIEYATENQICENYEDINNCSSEFFLNRLKNECKCVPFELQSFSQVCKTLVKFSKAFLVKHASFYTVKISGICVTFNIV